MPHEILNSDRSNLMRAWLTFGCVVFVGSLAWVFGRVQEAGLGVEIVRLSESTWNDFVPQGKEVDAIEGDYVLRNAYLTAVIADPLVTRHANMTVKDVGGCLIDLTTRNPQSDQLSAFYPGARRFSYRSAVARADAAEVDLGKTPIVKASAGEVTVVAEPGEGRPQVEVTYKLAADSQWLTVVSKFTNTGTQPLLVPLTDDFRFDHGKEEVTKSADGETDLYWVHDLHWKQSYGWFAERARILANSTPRGAAFQYVLSDDKPSVTIPPGQSFELTRHIVPAANATDVRALVHKEREAEHLETVDFLLNDGSQRNVNNARLDLFRNGQPWGTLVAGRDGRFRTPLPKGDYEVEIRAFGVTLVGSDERLKLKKRADRPLTMQILQIPNLQTGTVEATMTDADGKPLPCKIEFIGQGETPNPSFGPETADFAVKNLLYCPLGRGGQAMPVGSYEVLVSRGPEYDALITNITVQPRKETKLTGKLNRVVQTPGWVSTDFHSHSTPSGDNTSSQRGRVVNLVCEHIEFAPCTEHNRIDTYTPLIWELKVNDFLATCTGIELTGTPLPLNHQNAFPLKHKPRTQDGGAPVPDTDPVKQIERLAKWDNGAEKLVQINHPDFGWMTYDRDGDKKPDDGFQRMFEMMDVVEIHPIHTLLTFAPTYLYKGEGKPIDNRSFRWLQLLNQGFRLPAVVNTDSHYNYHGSGGLRNWVPSSSDDPAKILTSEIVRHCNRGRIIVSNGPYLEVSLSESGKAKTITAGESLDAKSGKVSLSVRVQCPNWFDIDRVVVLVNGSPHATHDYHRSKHSDRFRSGVVKFDEKLELSLTEDAHVIVVATGDKPLGKVAGPDWGHQLPTALSNPIYIDTDGDGFRPNKDTLGHPLPVKFETK
jgi:hypothetical protein